MFSIGFGDHSLLETRPAKQADSGEADAIFTAPNEGENASYVANLQRCNSATLRACN